MSADTTGFYSYFYSYSLLLKLNDNDDDEVLAETYSARLFNKVASLLIVCVSCACYLACRYLNGVRWWGKSIHVAPSTAKHVNMAREGSSVSNVTVELASLSYTASVM